MDEVTRIHQLLARDITLLSSSVNGHFYYSYLVMDVWSRYIVGVRRTIVNAASWLSISLIVSAATKGSD